MLKTKIICTLGPASSSETVIRKMMVAGMDVARLNFSHGKPPELFHRINLIRLLNTKYRRRIKILGDLQGHRIRTGELSEQVELKKRRILWLTQEKVKGTAGEIPFDYQGSLRVIKNGCQIFIDDGNIALEVLGRSGHKLKVKVIAGGLLKEHKGVNIPEARLEFGDISQKDIQDILFCEKHGVEYIAQSFVRTKKDILNVRKVLRRGLRCRVIAKIENREGIKNIDEIIKASDGIMIARGDIDSKTVFKVEKVEKIKPIFENDDLIVVDKPAHVNSDEIERQFKPAVLLHRLDKETSGVLMLVKNEEFREKAIEEFKKDRVYKEYIAWIEGILSEPVDIDRPILTTKKNNRASSNVSSKGKPARTEVFPDLVSGNKTKVKCIIHHGRTHQIRTHLRYIEHPIVGDEQYGGRRAKRVMLHAHKVRLLGMEFVAPEPKTFVHFE